MPPKRTWVHKLFKLNATSLPQCQHPHCVRYGYKTQHMMTHPCPTHVNVRVSMSTIQRILVALIMGSGVGIIVYKKMVAKVKQNIG